MAVTMNSWFLTQPCGAQCPILMRSRTSCNTTFLNQPPSQFRHQKKVSTRHRNGHRRLDACSIFRNDESHAFDGRFQDLQEWHDSALDEKSLET